MGHLTTHVLDSARGCPGQGIKIELFRLNSRREKVAEAVTNDDGRCDSPILEGATFTAGKYELIFHAGTYFDAQGYDLPDPKFLDEVSLRFGIAAGGEHYHVPLLLSPFSFSTYRGS